MNINLYQKLLLAYLVLLLVYWLILSQSGLTTDFWNYLYSFAFTLIPLIGGLFGLFATKAWGWFNSIIGRAVGYISLGLLSWGIGNTIWAYYNFFEGIAAPYPSWADAGFFLAIPFWIMGAVNLSKATGAKFGLRSIKGKAILVTLPITILAASYYLLVVVARDGVLAQAADSNLKLFLDIVYPFGDVAILTLALLVFGLSFDYFGGKYKLSIFSMLLGFFFMYLADFAFSYTTTVETFYNGNWGDLLFTLALFLITFGTLGFYKKVERLEVKTT